MGLHLVCQKCDEGRVECSCLCGFAGDGGTGLGVRGLGDSV